MKINFKNRITVLLTILLGLHITFLIMGYCLEEIFKIPDNWETLKSAIVSLNDNKKFWSIFGHNLSLGYILAAGAISLGIITIIIFILNSLSFGFISCFEIKKVGVLKYLSLILPHGIFEIPAMFYFTLAGMVPILVILNKIKKNNKKPKYYFVVYLKYCCFGTILMFIAALVEAFITSYFIKI